MVAGQMDKATLAIHTTKAPRPKPPASLRPTPPSPQLAGLNPRQNEK
jgi:PTH1 family peptidyl-tRNA hydrolase